MGLSHLEGTMSCHILPHSTHSSCGSAMSPGLSHGSAPSLVMGALPWKCDCPRVLLRAARRMLNTLQLPSAGHISFVPILHPPEYPWHWVYSSHSLWCMWRQKASASFPKPLHLLVITGKYQTWAKHLACVCSHLHFLTVLSKSGGSSSPFSWLAFYSLWVETAVSQGHLWWRELLLSISLCFLGSFLAVTLALRVFSVFEKLSSLTTPGNYTVSSFACYTNLTSTLPYLETFVTSGNIWQPHVWEK